MAGTFMWTTFHFGLSVGAVLVAGALAVWFAIRARSLQARWQNLTARERHLFDFIEGADAAFSGGAASPALHRLIVESALSVLGARSGILYVADKTATRFVAGFAAGDCPAFSPGAAAGGASGIPPVLPGDGSHIGDFCRATVPAFLAPGERGFSPEHTAIIGPLVHCHHVLGVLAVCRHAGSPAFSQADLRVFRAVAAQGALVLHSDDVQREAGEKRLLERDLEIARDVQRILLPDTPPAFPGYEISAVNHAARHLSGDYFDYIPLGADRLGVAIADVSGKGVPASLIMAMCRGALRREAFGNAPASDVLQRVNSELYPDLKEDMFISMAYAVFEREGGKVTLARAGHDAPLLFRAANGSVEKINPRGMALGIDSGEVFNRVCADSSFAMEPGDCMLLYTDGATEALDPRGIEYGLDRLSLALKASAPRGAAEVVRHVSEDVGNFASRDLMHDDFTLIAISKK